MRNIKLYENLEDFLSANKNCDNNYLLLVAEYCDFDFDKLKQSNLKFYGAIVTQVVFNDDNFDNKLIACELEDEKVKLIQNLNEPLLDEEYFKSAKSMMVILDGLSPEITPFLDSLFHHLPLDIEIIGAGAGKITLKQEPVIFSNEGIFQNAALTISMSSSLSVGVENGWEYLEGPFIVTSSQKNVLKSLNFASAYQVYKDTIKKHTGQIVTEENFFDIAKYHPLGIVKFNNEIIVRDPVIKDEDENMVVIGDIEQNSTVNILKGDKNSLLSSSSNAIIIALESQKVKYNQKMYLYLIVFQDAFFYKKISKKS